MRTTRFGVSMTPTTDVVATREPAVAAEESGLAHAARRAPYAGDARTGRATAAIRRASAAIPPSILRTLTAFTARSGVDLRPALAAVGLHEDVMASTSLRVSYRQSCAVIRRALELTGDARLGLRVGVAEQMTTWGLAGFAGMAAETLRHAIETGVRYQRSIGWMVVWSAGEERDGYVARAELPDPSVDPEVAAFLHEKAFATAVNQTRLGFSPEFRPVRVEFSHRAPVDTTPYDQVFGCPVVFGAPANRLVYCPTLVHSPMPGANPATFASATECLEAQLSAGRGAQELSETLEISIAQSLPEVPSFAEQARRHALSERTLRRRLAVDGTSYEAIVDGGRRERVEHLLRDGDRTLRDIAHQAGFADERGLRRAIRRWYGMSSAELRRHLADNAG
ncbi:AraC family transcriptional regulator [Kutzneria kofuensis]|uniref:AraC-like DNA-binding protein n=1 Tax=Kutzneria kofuensis TaxID=103725 RepID=A0A7W9KFU0_9PSEU|nr:AraC family transcriptional regulator [Kutzneria kofuensis]MBB5891363.1 AraC-like DNA-binding protein [Kutzneria kofuensis]